MVPKTYVKISWDYPFNQCAESDPNLGKDLEDYDPDPDANITSNKRLA
jgi:hypothetical protein